MNFAEGTFAGLAGEEIALFQRLLADLAGEGVEIGCLDGYSTAHILECSKLRLTSIDPFIPDSMAPHLIGSRARFSDNVAPWKERSTLVEDYSWNVAGRWDQPLEFLFIDGDHAYPSVLRDLGEWSPHLRPGGILAMHDSRMPRPGGAPFHPGPSQVASELVYGRPDRWEIVGEAFSLTVARKRP
jgi:predicted O-methyltransferase YrrM